MRHDLDHLATNLANLCRLCIAVGLDLLWSALRESDAKHADDVAVSRLDIYLCLDERLPLLDQAADLVACERHAMEVREAASALDLFDAETDLLGSLVLVVVQIRQVHL